MHIFNHVVFAACYPAPKGMYDGSLNPVSSTQFLRKTPCTSLETEQASPREATGTSRAPRRRRRLQQRCMARLLNSSLRGSRALTRAVVVWARAGRCYCGCGVALLLGELRRLDPVDGGHGDRGRGHERPAGGLERRRPFVQLNWMDGGDISVFLFSLSF